MNDQVIHFAFNIQGHIVRFGLKELYLITSLNNGEYPKFDEIYRENEITFTLGTYISSTVNQLIERIS